MYVFVQILYIYMLYIFFVKAESRFVVVQG